MSQPDPHVMAEFCRDHLPKLLREACDVDLGQSEAIGRDVLARAEAFAALDRDTQRILAAPFMEEVVNYEPRDASLQLKASVTVVVRNSQLEEAHAHGPLNSGGIEILTHMAAGPLSHLLAARRQQPVAVADNMFSHLPTAGPRAWACLAVLADTLPDGGRSTLPLPKGPLPALPGLEERIEAQAAKKDSRAVVLSAIDPRFDQNLIDGMRQVERGLRMIWVPKLSHFSRNFDKLLRVLEYMLAHKVNVATTNYLLRPNEVWVRLHGLIPAHSLDPKDGLGNPRGLSGAHRKIAKQLLVDLRR